MKTTRMGGGLLTVALMLSLTPSTAGGTTTANVNATNALGFTIAVPSRTVTLITGDKVTVAANGATTIARGKGRDNVRFITSRADGRLRVVPSDALLLLQNGRLDRRLFDVTALLEFGYDKRADIPLIVSGTGTAKAGAAAAATAGGKVVRDLPAINGSAVRAAKDSTFWTQLTGSAGTLKNEIGRIWLDARRKPLLDVSVPQIGAPTAWAAGFDGAGVTVGLLDSGADRNHPDLAGQIAASMNFTEGEESDEDVEGHGTHVASTILGTGAASGGRFKGVAPGAKLLAGKVCVVQGCAESWILAGMQWAAENHATAVNMSLGGPDTPEIDPLEQAVQTLTEQFGTLFVIAAGNSGPGANTVASPGAADLALTVGAVEKSDEIAEFSSRGPRVGDSALKPDITGPGVNVVAAFSTSAGGGPGNYYLSGSGTSMATPHVVGAAAILKQRRPDFTPAQLKAALMASAKPHAAQSVFDQGAGRVDVARAINQTVFADPPSLSLGRQIWPHGDDTPITKTVTYQNIGTSDVTLSIALNTTGPDGNPAPAGMFTLSANTLAVPAGGRASVTLTADTRVASPDGLATGRLVATAGGSVTQTPFAVDKEAESYTLSLTHFNRDGQAPLVQDSLIVRTDSSGFFQLTSFDQTSAIRLPKGTYTLFSLNADVPDPEAPPLINLGVQPRIELTSDQSVTVDARLSKPFAITVPRPGQTQLFGDLSGTTTTPDGRVSIGIGGQTLDGINSLTLGPSRPVAGFHTQLSATFARVDANGDPYNSPDVYNLSWITQGRFITGATHPVRDRDLATVVSRHAQQDANTFGEKGSWGLAPGPFEFPPAVSLLFDLPFTRTEYYNTDGGARWVSLFFEIDPASGPQAATLQQPQTYRAGKTHHEEWNRGVFGPAVGRPTDPAFISTRIGDRMHLFVPTHGDGAGRTGLANPASGRTALFKDGVLVGQIDQPGAEFAVPAGSGRYRLEVGIQRQPGTSLSTSVSGVWTFRSGHTTGLTTLPLWTVSFSPPLNERNTAAAGRTITIPVSAVSASGSDAGRLRSLRVEVSFDGGATWRNVPVAGNAIRVTNPSGTGFVSLRAVAADTRDNTVTQTIINAYRFG